MASDSSLGSFINQFEGGNRQHRYDVSMQMPAGISTPGANNFNRFFVRAVSLPPSQVNPIRVPYRGRILKWPGDRVYFPWTMRILDQNSGKNRSLWNDFHRWSDKINDHVTNISSDDWNNFTTDWTIKQINTQGDTIKTIKLIDCWPTVVGPITLDSNTIDTLVEFTVTVEYQWYEVEGIN
tara:strand:+ start:491 stop:1033 length:543 start_codon:yes stop_codon:yes gene_type:complete